MANLCLPGFLVGVIIVLLLLGVYLFWFRPSSGFIDPSSDPRVAALLAYENARDPGSAAAMRKMYPGQENFVEKR
jgi:hypothetical protein